MSAPTYQAAGSIFASTGGGTVDWPTHMTGDVALLVVETANEVVTLSDAQGFAAVSNSPQGTGTAGGTSAARLTAFWRRATSGSMTGPTLADPGDHVIAQIITFRGCVATGNPWDITAGDVEPTATSAVTIPGFTTATANCLIVDLVAERRDNADAGFDQWVNASLTSFTARLRVGSVTNVGNGGGFGMATGIKATAGVVSATTARVMQNNGASGLTSEQGRLKIALKPLVAVAPMPVFQAAGVAVHGTGAVTAAWPTHIDNDVALLLVESANESITLSTAAGFVEVADSPQGTGTGGGTSATKLAAFWCRATSNAMTSPTVADPGDHVIAQILTFRGCETSGNPWDVTSGDTEPTDTADVVVPGDTTTVPNCLVVLCCAHRKDTSQLMFTGWANGDLTNIVELTDVSTSDGNGGGFGAACGGKAVAGPYGTTAAILDLASKQGRLSIALKPPQTVTPGPGDPSAAHQFWRMLKTNGAAAGPAVNEVELVRRSGVAGATGSTIRLPAKVHPAITHIVPTMVFNWFNDGSPDGETDVDLFVMAVPAGMSTDLPTDQVTRRVDLVSGEDGTLREGVGQDDGGNTLPLVKGVVRGTGRHGDPITFSQAGRIFQQVPKVAFSGGIAYSPGSATAGRGFGTAAEVDAGTANNLADTTAPEYEDFAARDLTDSGFTLSARLRQKAVTAARSLSFAGTVLDTTGESDTVSTLTNAPSNDDQYTLTLVETVRLRSLTGSRFEWRAQWVLETSINSGATWQPRVNGASGFQTNSTAFVSYEATRAIVFAVAGLTADGTDRVRLRLTDVSIFGIGEFDSPNCHVVCQTLTFHTSADSFCSKTPDTDDVVSWEAVGYV